MFAVWIGVGYQVNDEKVFVPIELDKEIYEKFSKNDTIDVESEIARSVKVCFSFMKMFNELARIDNELAFNLYDSLKSSEKNDLEFFLQDH
jgi:hypothetical protein